MDAFLESCQFSERGRHLFREHQLLSRSQPAR
jgi:hypothetical protein